MVKKQFPWFTKNTEDKEEQPEVYTKESLLELIKKKKIELKDQIYNPYLKAEGAGKGAPQLAKKASSKKN